MAQQQPANSHPVSHAMSRKPARMALADGTILQGLSIGAIGTTLGEIVFNTSATGYQEILTDPSYKGQIVLMTHPEIGNYGVNQDDYESAQIHAVGFVVSRLSPFCSSWRAEQPLQAFLQRNNVVGIEGVDTRAITRRIRQHGVMKAGISSDETLSDKDFLAQVRAQPSFEDCDFIGQVTRAQPETIKTQIAPGAHRLDRMVIVDYGMKDSILTYLKQSVAEITIVPATTTFEQIQSYRPQAVLLSNGPGDPSVLTEAVKTAALLSQSGIPTFGICLGHQILGLACGAKVTKMPFGHHGGNHPVKDLELDRIFITSQNHGYCVEFDAFPEDDLAVTHINLNDKTIEGFRHRHAPVMSVQFHPEAAPGPQEANYIFESFMQTAIQASKPTLVAS
jgi:carbamoyl-phosphate synthase small subunit